MIPRHVVEGFLESDLLTRDSGVLAKKGIATDKNRFGARERKDRSAREECIEPQGRHHGQRGTLKRHRRGHGMIHLVRNRGAGWEGSRLKRGWWWGWWGAQPKSEIGCGFAKRESTASRVFAMQIDLAKA